MEVLFAKGKSKLTFPLKVVVLETPVKLIYPAQAMFIVPKRIFKRAHDRNKLKRRMREAYRLNKYLLYEKLLAADKKMILAFIYVGKEEKDYLTIEKSLKKILGIIT